MPDFHVMLEDEIKKNGEAGKIPRLLLHCCCAPCSSYCLEFLNGHFDITCFFYNPNITDKDEYLHRLNELKNYVFRALNGAYPVIDGGFGPDAFYRAALGKEKEREGGERCFSCYSLRLAETYKNAVSGGYDYFGTTLTVSPHKRADKINEIGFALAEGGGVKYLPSDFKKRGGYLRSIQLSKEYGLYRQNYCGCEFSRKAAEERV